jgi:hypothetical protein
MSMQNIFCVHRDTTPSWRLGLWICGWIVACIVCMRALWFETTDKLLPKTTQTTAIYVRNNHRWIVDNATIIEKECNFLSGAGLSVQGVRTVRTNLADGPRPSRGDFAGTLVAPSIQSTIQQKIATKTCSNFCTTFTMSNISNSTNHICKSTAQF